MSKSKIQSLQMFRGFAALAVVAHHADVATDAFVGALAGPFSKWFGMGLLGVDFFFVLSGFIIMYAHMDDDCALAAWKLYAFKRLSRIYPAYIPVGVGLVVLYAAMPGLSAAGGGVTLVCLALSCCCPQMAHPHFPWRGPWYTS
jgi:exopolysaccharide production protein ExoZ